MKKHTFSEIYPRPLFGLGRKIGLREIRQGYEYPFGWGLAYWDYLSLVAYIYPIPFNWIIWLAREIYHRLRNVPTGFAEKIWIDGYRKGIADNKKFSERWKNE